MSSHALKNRHGESLSDLRILRNEVTNNKGDVGPVGLKRLGEVPC